MATIPSRKAAIVIACESLADQADAILVYANYGPDEAPPAGLPDNVVWRQAPAGNLTDAGKFYGLPTEADTVILTCDDDLVYPPDYAARCASALALYPDALVTFHGKTFRTPGPIGSYYSSESLTAKYRCLEAVTQDALAHVPGSGVSAWRVGALAMASTDCRTPRMADIWLAIAAQRQRVPVIVLAHKRGWIQHIPIDFAATIWAQDHNNDGRQTAIVNGRTWELFEPGAAERSIFYRS
jgi:hypothetical protein